MKLKKTPNLNNHLKYTFFKQIIKNGFLILLKLFSFEFKYFFYKKIVKLLISLQNPKNKLFL